MESVILNSPILCILYAVALFMCIFDLANKSTGYIFPILSLLVTVGATAYALISGASLYEAAIAVLIFLALNITAFAKGGKK